LTTVNPSRICKSSPFDSPPNYRNRLSSFFHLGFRTDPLQQSIRSHTKPQAWSPILWQRSPSRPNIHQKVGPSASSCLCSFGLVFLPLSLLRSRANPSLIPSSGSSISPSLIPILGSLGFSISCFDSHLREWQIEGSLVEHTHAHTHTYFRDGYLL
jgi:hypothetical protein